MQLNVGKESLGRDMVQFRWILRPRPGRVDDKHASAPPESVPTLGNSAFATRPCLDSPPSYCLRRTSSQHSLVAFRSASFHTAPSQAGTSGEFGPAGDLSGHLVAAIAHADAPGSQTVQEGETLEWNAPEPAHAPHHHRGVSSCDAWAPRVAALQIQPPRTSTDSFHQSCSRRGESTPGQSLDEHLEASWPWFMALVRDARWAAADAHIQQLEHATGLPRGDIPRALEACGQSSAADAETALASLRTMLQGLTRFEDTLAEQEGYHQSSQKPLQVLPHTQNAPGCLR